MLNIQYLNIEYWILNIEHLHCSLDSISRLSHTTLDPHSRQYDHILQLYIVG